MSRKSDNQNFEEEAGFDSNSYDIDPKCRVLIFAFGRYLKLVSTHVPDYILKHLLPSFKAWEHKYSPAKLQEVK